MYPTRHFTGSVVFLAAVVAVTATSAQDLNTSPNREKELLQVLRSDAPGGEKAIACKNLAIHGSSEAVPELAKLLPNEQLSSWARTALEAIPGAEADEALRTASNSLEGKLLVGTINSIGVRRDAAAVDLLTKRLKDNDSQVASAAAVALGNIGNDAAAGSLRVALASAPADVRSAVAEGYLLCAERLQADAQSENAVAIYDEIRSADLPLQRTIEATRGAILARDQGGIPLLMETFQSPNKKMFQLALGTVREFPGGEVDKTLVTAMSDAPPQRAALIIQAMADRPQTVVLAAVLNAARKGDLQVRFSAIDALKRVGDESCLDALLQIAVAENGELAIAAKETLAELPGRNVDTRIVALLPTAQGKSYPLLIELVGQRRIDAVPDLLKALNHSDTQVRGAAMIALGETIKLDRLSLLVSQVVSPKYPADTAVAQQALKAASVRMPDREACAVELATALSRAPAGTKSYLLEVLGEVGGDSALQTLANAAKSSDPQLQDTGSRLLGKWNSVDAAPVLLDLAKNAPAEKYQIRALRGYIGVARKFAMPDGQRAEMCRSALEISRRADEQKLVLEVLKLHASIAGLKLAIEVSKTPALQADATAAAREIARKLRRKGVDVSKVLSDAGL
jgi:HEAT repeat protein